MRRLCLALWNSPTFTTWGSYAAQALRLLALTPLLVTRFESPEIAAWFLFGSLMFFGDMVSTRVGLTFSRMVAFAMGGASDLAPIKDRRKPGGDGRPNWPLIDRTYGTVGGLNAVLAFAGALAAVGMGIYALVGITSASGNPTAIWKAFGVFVSTRLLVDFNQRYALALRGMNYVALTARWDVVFSLLSTIAGAVALWLGGGIFHLAVTMQTVLVLNVFRMRFLLFHVEQGRFRAFKPFRYDREVIGWAKEPFFKGLAVSLSNNGVLQLAGVVFARHATVEAAAAYLFTMRLLDSAKQISGVPFISFSPSMSRWLAEGRTEELRETVPRRILMATCLFALAAWTLVLAGKPLVELIRANSNLLDGTILSVLAFVVGWNQYVIYSLFVSAAANHVVCFKRTLAALLVSVALIFVLVPQWGLPGLVLALFLPQAAVLNLAPSLIAAERLGIAPARFIGSSYGAAFAAHALLCLYAFAIW